MQELLQRGRFVGYRPFSVYLTFYRREPDEILILRVLHGMRDLPPLLEGGA